MSSSSTPSLGVVSVTITLPGPWTVIVHWSPWRSVPETILPSLVWSGTVVRRIQALSENSSFWWVIGFWTDRSLGIQGDKYDGIAVERTSRLSRASGYGHVLPPDRTGPVRPPPCESHGRLPSRQLAKVRRLYDRSVKRSWRRPGSRPPFSVGHPAMARNRATARS